VLAHRAEYRGGLPALSAKLLDPRLADACRSATAASGAWACVRPDAAQDAKLEPRDAGAGKSAGREPDDLERNAPVLPGRQPKRLARPALLEPYTQDAGQSAARSCAAEVLAAREHSVSLALPSWLHVVKLKPRLEATVPRASALPLPVLLKARLVSRPQARAVWALPRSEELLEL
jgi:hypothetical protein